MPPAAPQMAWTPESFLEWERVQASKHEYFDGEVFAMAGGSPRHNALTAAVAAELRAALRGRGCQVFSADQRIAAPRGKRYLYADASVVCGPLALDPEQSDCLENPCVLVEVLSPSTEANDRGVKWQAYRALPSLEDYVLVHQETAQLEHDQREGQTWRFRVLGPDDTLTLRCGASVSVSALYEGGVLELES